MFLLLVAALSAVAIALYWNVLGLWSSVRMWYYGRKLPGPRAFPILGNTYDLINKSPEYLLIVIKNYFEVYGKTFRYWVLNQLLVLIGDVRDVEAVLRSTDHIQKSDEYNFLKRWLRDGLLISKGKKWSQRRKILTPAFHFNVLERYIEIFEKESKIFVRNLEKERLKGGTIYLEPFINACTLDVICETAMGVSINAQTDTDSEYVRAVKKIASIVQRRTFDVICRLDLTYFFTKSAREEKKALKVLHGFTEKVIVQRREELLKEQTKKGSNGNTGHKEEHDIGSKRKMAFLDILLQSNIEGKPLSNLEIREEVDTFMFEGHDTTSSAINFFFFNMALYSDCQQKCFEEIFSIFGTDKTKPVTSEDLSKLHYVELCIKETLRLYPSVPLLGRKLNKDCEINGKKLAKDTNVGICLVTQARYEELFPDACAFKPERFDVVTSAEKMNPYAYIPFSAGPRNCIGQKFAMLEIKTIAANALRHFHFDYAGDKDVAPVLVAELILRTVDPLMFRITPRIYPSMPLPL